MVEREVDGAIDLDSGKVANRLPESVSKSDDIAESVFPPDKQRAMIEGTLRVAREFGSPLAIYWQVYCNEAVKTPMNSNKDVRGFGLVRPDGTHTLAWELLRDAKW